MPDYTITLTADQDSVLEEKAQAGSQTKAQYVQGVLNNLTNNLLTAKYNRWFSTQTQAAKKADYDQAHA